MTYKRIDANQKEIIAALRAAGASVRSLAALGHGIPDLLVGFRGVNFLIEVKNKAGRGDRLTEDETEFIQEWRGQVVKVFCVDDALSLLGVVCEYSTQN
jgi:Holliday junction resolvase